jgi:hypothetical protein
VDIVPDWKEARVTHATPDFGDRMPCCGLTVGEWRKLGNKILSTTGVRGHVTCLGVPRSSAEDYADQEREREIPEPEGGVWRVDLSQEPRDQVRSEPLNEMQQHFASRVAQDARNEMAAETLKEERKARAQARLAVMARDGNTLYQDTLDILGVPWRAE